MVLTFYIHFLLLSSSVKYVKCANLMCNNKTQVKLTSHFLSCMSSHCTCDISTRLYIVNSPLRQTALA